jgi:Domain of unknown function (DUF1737)
MKIDDYKIIRGKDLFDLESSVKMSIKLGWYPVGGVMPIVIGGSYSYFIQAMVKE